MCYTAIIYIFLSFYIYIVLQYQKVFFSSVDTIGTKKMSCPSETFAYYFDTGWKIFDINCLAQFIDMIYTLYVINIIYHFITP